MAQAARGHSGSRIPLQLLLLAFVTAAAAETTTTTTIRYESRPVSPRKLDARFWLGPRSVNGLAPNTTEGQCATLSYRTLRDLASSRWALCSPPAAAQASPSPRPATSSITCYDDASHKANQTFCVSSNILLDSRAFMGGCRSAGSKHRVAGRLTARPGQAGCRSWAR
jgi:hypothetical protein